MISGGNGKNGSTSGKRGIIFSEKQLAKKFKHAADFGIKGNYNKENIAKFKAALEKHVLETGTTPITGIYRGLNVAHYVNPQTGLNVIVLAGEFHSGWKLTAEQLKHVLLTGKLGGG